jgi:hypothetical protein
MSSHAVTREPESLTDFALRLARRTDSSALAKLFASVVLDSDMSLAVERDPDFFALYDMETLRGDQRVWVVEMDGKVEGVGSFLGRDAHLKGTRLRTAYMSDLRASERARKGRVFGAVMEQGFRGAQRELGADIMYTAVFDSNRAAQKALVLRSPRYPTKPYYHPFRKFTITSLQLLTPRALRPSRYRVRMATQRDLDALIGMLAKDHKERPFGYAFDQGLLEQRLAQWPRFGLENFYLAVDARDNILGCTATWDGFDVKRYRVRGYRGPMRWVKRGYNAAASLTGACPLPEPGELLRYLYLTHVCVPSDDPGVMASLLDAIYAASWKRGYSFLMAYVGEQDPLAPAYRGFVTSGLKATLYAVSPHDKPLDVQTLGHGKPGFEIALA